MFFRGKKSTSGPKLIGATLVLTVAFIVSSWGFSVPCTAQPRVHQSSDEKLTFQLIRQKPPPREKAFHPKKKKVPLLFIPTEKKSEKNQTRTNATFAPLVPERQFFGDWLKINIYPDLFYHTIFHIVFHPHPRDPPFLSG